MTNREAADILNAQWHDIMAAIRGHYDDHIFSATIENAIQTAIDALGDEPGLDWWAVEA